MSTPSDANNPQLEEESILPLETSETAEEAKARHEDTGRSRLEAERIARGLQ